MHDILKTDKYKFTMAEAGFPLRKETFYYTHRKNGPHFLPFDVKQEIINTVFGEWNSNFFKNSIEGAYEWLGENVITVSDAVREAFKFDSISSLEINSLPAGSWFFDNEPVFTITGPSALVSWLEPTLIRFNYKIQLATLALTDQTALFNEINTAVCGEHAQIIYNTISSLSEMGFKIPVKPIENIRPGPGRTSAYFDEINKKAKDLVSIVKDPRRIFEVGMRSVTCKQQHELALEACSKAKIKMTSSVYQAWNLDINSVGTMGHEHVQRYGNDKEAFRAMADRIPGSIFCLLDTFDTINSGLKHSYSLIREQPERDHAIRFDSGDTEALFKEAYVTAQKYGIKPRFCFEDGWNLEKTIKFERIRESLGISPERFLYGFGGYLTNTKFISLNRDRVGAVYKLCKTGDKNTMKFSDTPEKQSIPGKPVILRPRLTTSKNRNETIVAQEGEEVVGDYVNAFEEPAIVQRPNKEPIRKIKYSNKTQEIINRLTRNKN